ncbi:MAG: hypothetical protein PHS93_05685 [Candidatus Omnitrophica bacterium]|nr:hypothetical protein [Candidatus Omnitrophota bacterium]MDD5352641.1 hypothetical protein [Candidatus Omnitrophota bacterium]MDD5550240.1 hypothetical protein [Candidatus Omnitrophota bacterium]
MKMVLSTDKGAALLTVIAIIFILMILSSVMLSLLANQTRLVEHDIARAKAKYATEAVMVRQIDNIRRTQSFLASPQSVTGRYDSDVQNWNVIFSNTTSTFPGTTKMNITLDYSTPL